MQFDCIFQKEESSSTNINVTSDHSYDVSIQNDTISEEDLERQMVNLTINFCGSTNQGIGCDTLPDNTGGFLSNPLIKLAVIIASSFLMLIILVLIFTKCIVNRFSSQKQSDLKKRMQLIKVFEAKLTKDGPKIAL